jgi:ADP-ribosyl-[dinitrogen reductase] hydrolase
LLINALEGQPRDDLLICGTADFDSERVNNLAQRIYLSKEVRQIKGSGYCVESLEAALWCFAQSNSFKEAVLAATNLGDDADTTAAIVGQLAGAHYGAQGIPEEWLNRLFMRGEIDRLALELAEQAHRCKSTPR